MTTSRRYDDDEMCFVIFAGTSPRQEELSRIVNDNVRYAREEVPVDLILSDFAETFCLTTRHIYTLRRRKSNSSQQIRSHCRTELRKCVYVCEKAERV